MEKKVIEIELNYDIHALVLIQKDIVKTTVARYRGDPKKESFVDLQKDILSVLQMVEKMDIVDVNAN